jgi:hypothetical protein
VKALLISALLLAWPVSDNAEKVVYPTFAISARILFYSSILIEIGCELMFISL